MSVSGGSPSGRADRFSEELLNRQTELLAEMQQRMRRRSAKELSRLIDAIILYADNAVSYIDRLKVPALAIVGEDGYVGVPPKLETWKVPGRHISPQESVEKPGLRLPTCWGWLIENRDQNTVSSNTVSSNIVKGNGGN